MILYLDTSALFRLYVPEPNREQVLAAVRISKMKCTHLIGYAEFHSAVAKAERMKNLDAIAAKTICEQFEHDWAGLNIVLPDEALMRRASSLIRRFGLRAYDGVHLAAAERVTVQGGKVCFACSDQALNAAAQTLGLVLLQDIHFGK